MHVRYISLHLTYKNQPSEGKHTIHGFYHITALNCSQIKAELSGVPKLVSVAMFMTSQG